MLLRFRFLSENRETQPVTPALVRPMLLLPSLDHHLRGCACAANTGRSNDTISIGFTKGKKRRAEYMTLTDRVPKRVQDTQALRPLEATSRLLEKLAGSFE